MNKKGITLVELISALVLISLIALIAIPLITGLLKDSKEDSDKINRKNIQEAAALYLADNIGSTIDFSTNNTTTVTLQQLVDGGYISGDLKDQISGSNYNLDTSIVTISKENNSYKYTLNLNTN
jgi:type IV pilus assembly protein PilA